LPPSRLINYGRTGVSLQVDTEGGGATGHALKNQELPEFFVKVRRGKEDRTQLAHVVVAHRLLTLCYFALRDERGRRGVPCQAVKATTTRSRRARKAAILRDAGRLLLPQTGGQFESGSTAPRAAGT